MIQNNENSSRNQDQIDFKELYDLILLKKKLVLFVTTTLHYAQFSLHIVCQTFLHQKFFLLQHYKKIH